MPSCKTLAADPKFRQKAAALVRARRQYLEAPTWFQRQHADAPLTGVAYFSMEFMLSEALPIYSGGLGTSPATSSSRRAIWACR